MELTQEYLKTLFVYKNGELFWKIEPGPGRLGKSAGTFRKGNKGRNMVNLDGKRYYRSRLIFLWHKGYLPPIVDHKDRDVTNDKIGNLRAATILQNNRNACLNFKNAKSKFKGVSPSQSNKSNPWTAGINIGGGERILIGRFKTEIEAAKAYNEAAKQHFGEFAFLNKV